MLPYENATSGEKAVQEMQKILRSFGCDKFGHMMHFDTGELQVQFTYRDKTVVVKASFSGYAKAWLRENPYKRRMRKTEAQHNKEASERASVAVYSVLRDWIKGQITAIETEILPFEGAFLGQILTQSGQTVLEVVMGKKLLTCSKEET